MERASKAKQAASNKYQIQTVKLMMDGLELVSPFSLFRLLVSVPFTKSSSQMKMSPILRRSRKARFRCSVSVRQSSGASSDQPNMSVCWLDGFSLPRKETRKRWCVPLQDQFLTLSPLPKNATTDLNVKDGSPRVVTTRFKSRPYCGIALLNH
jgi:hypothetical protein